MQVIFWVGVLLIHMMHLGEEMLINEKLISPKGNGKAPLADEIKNKIKQNKNSPSMTWKSERQSWLQFSCRETSPLTSSAPPRYTHPCWLGQLSLSTDPCLGQTHSSHRHIHAHTHTHTHHSSLLAFNDALSEQLSLRHTSPPPPRQGQEPFFCTPKTFFTLCFYSTCPRLLLPGTDAFVLWTWISQGQRVRLSCLLSIPSKMVAPGTKPGAWHACLAVSNAAPPSSIH